jgi:lysophospholipase L1-like esterase
MMTLTPFLLLIWPAPSSAQAAPPGFTGTWAVAPVKCGAQAGLQGTTLRQIVHVSIGGRAIRLHLSNLYGTGPLIVESAQVASWNAQTGSPSGTARMVSFQGTRRAVIPSQTEQVSDPIRFHLHPFADIAITFLIAQASGPATCHPAGFQTNYIADGDETAGQSFHQSKTKQSYYYLTNLEVIDRKASGAIVAFGASITNGYRSTPNANLRWPNDLAVRLASAGLRIGVLNQGIGGNRLLIAGSGDSAEARFERDVLNQPGARWVIFSDDPINDLGSTKPPPSAEQLISGLQTLIDRAHARRLRFLCSTLTPYEGANYWTPAGEAAREQINSFIRGKNSGCDLVVDQDEATHDPNHPSRYLPAYDSGDHLHPNDAGMRAIAGSVPLASLLR